MEKRDEIVERLKRQIDQWNREIGELETKGRMAKKEVRAAAEQQVKELRDRRAELQVRLGELQRAGEGAWQELAQGLETASDALKKSFQKAWDRLKL